MFEKVYFDKISNKQLRASTKVAHLTINVMCDYTRKLIINDTTESANDSRAVHFIATADVSTYLLRSKKIMALQIFFERIVSEWTFSK